MAYTSTEVKNRYNRKAYDQLNVRIHKGRLSEVQELASECGLSLAELVRHGIDLVAKENGYSTLFCADDSTVKACSLIEQSVGL